MRNPYQIWIGSYFCFTRWYRSDEDAIKVARRWSRWFYERAVTHVATRYEGTSTGDMVTEPYPMVSVYRLGLTSRGIKGKNKHLLTWELNTIQVAGDLFLARAA